MLRPRPNAKSMNFNCVVKVLPQLFEYTVPHHAFFLRRSHSVHFTLFAVLIELVGLASLQSDIKSIASTWKHISKLAIGYHTIYRTQQQQLDLIESDSNDESLEWLNVCVESICKSIAENVQKSLDAVNDDWNHRNF